MDHYKIYKLLKGGEIGGDLGGGGSVLALFRRYIFKKNTRGGDEIGLPPAALGLRSSNKHVALQNLSIYYTWKNIRKQ